METPIKEKANVALFIRLSPPVAQVARMLKVSRETVYGIINGTANTKPETIRRFNDYLDILFRQRMKASRQVT